MSYQGIRQSSDDGEIEIGNAYRPPHVLPDVVYQKDPSARPLLGRLLKYLGFAATIGIVGTIFYKILSLHSSLVPVNKPATSDTALFDDNGRYVMRNFDEIKPNANFLCGLGGVWGVPMVR